MIEAIHLRAAPLLALAIMVLPFSPHGFSQPGPAEKFEVATVKLSPPPEGDLININLGRLQGGRLSMTNVTLNDAIKFAYELVSDAQISGPDWIKTIRFDIVAEAPPDTPLERVHLMTRALLAERLHLVVGHEQKVLPYLALVVGKGGSKLPRAKPDQPVTPGFQVRGRIDHNQMSMLNLVSLLSRFERQTIVDRTGLSGLFEVKLEWAPDSNVPQVNDAGPPPDRPSLFAAVEEQLGLKLESRRGPLGVLVVEQAAKAPEEN
jgi:uncharacterized protein (TIGR03435 family)